MSDEEHIEENDGRESIHLEQFLKIQGFADTGGQAKIMIQSGQVEVNGHTETRRKRQLFHGDRVVAFGREVPVEFD